uniref:Uncharacterized mitochondrial protein AtMg00810-like n=1 Tax=Nicotiana tabacum TaxID=4097 RepID=A0A1S3Z8P0_TOBAC|nr:PREDICTED: uncharacterized mitochondrial protein AtMg00810-like [Nicotiana tabacum]
MSIVKTLIVVVVKKNWPIFQLDVNNAFLHGDLAKKVFMKLPPGLSVSTTSAASISTPLGSGDALVLLVVYVDDIIITGTYVCEIAAVKNFLHDQFKIKDLGHLNYFMGNEVLYSEGRMLLHQKKFVHNLLKEFHSYDCSSVISPIVMHDKLQADHGDPLPNPESYRCLVGKLNFLTRTRLDICFAVQHLSQFMQKPCLPYMQVVLRLLSYLNDSKKSISGFCLLLRGCLVGWKSKKQSVVSLSFAEIEYRSMSKATAEITWVCRLLYDFGVVFSSPVTLFCDNQAAIYIAKNFVFHERRKHIELDCHFVRTKLNEGLLQLLHTSSANQLADMFTKPLGGAIHHLHLRKLGVISSSNLSGGIEIQDDDIT